MCLQNTRRLKSEAKKKKRLIDLCCISNYMFGAEPGRFCLDGLVVLELLFEERLIHVLQAIYKHDVNLADHSMSVFIFKYLM